MHVQCDIEIIHFIVFLDRELIFFFNVLTAKMKKSSWTQDTTPKFVNLKTLSIIHIT